MSRQTIYQTIALVPAQTAGMVAIDNTAKSINPEVFAKPFPVACQQYDAMPWQGLLATTPTPRGWYERITDYQFAKPFPVGAQQWMAFQPGGNFRSTTPQGWWGYQLDYQFAKPFPIQDQIYTTWPEPQKFPPGLGWWGYQLDYAFTKPLNAALQVFETPFVPQGVIISFVFKGYFGHHIDYSFTKPFSVTEQRFTEVLVNQFIKPQYGEWGYQFDYKFTPTFPPSQQQYDAWPPEVVLPFFPPGSGKRYKPPTDYLPEPAWDKGPNKPVRPIWDRPAKPAPKVEPAPPPTPLPPLSAFAERGPPRIMRKLNLPSFNDQIPANTAQLNQHLPQLADEGDAIAALRALGIIKDNE